MSSYMTQQARLDDPGLKAKADGWLKDAIVDVDRCIAKLNEAMEYVPPPYKSEVREQIKALQAIRFCVSDLRAQRSEEGRL